MKCKDCDACVKGFFKSKPDAYICIGVPEPFVIGNINSECTEYKEKRTKTMSLENECKEIYLRCDDKAEFAVFSKYEWTDGVDYEISIEDSYCGGDFMGIKGRFKRAWRAFLAKPVCYTAVFVKIKIV